VKIKDIIKQNSEKKASDTLPPLQKEVLGFFEQHKGEAFSYNDAKIYEELNDKKSTAIGWSIWSLERKGFLAKKKVGRKTYHGLPKDIKRLDAGLKQGGD
jgi:hypothetical protein